MREEGETIRVQAGANVWMKVEGVMGFGRKGRVLCIFMTPTDLCCPLTIGLSEKEQEKQQV